MKCRKAAEQQKLGLRPVTKLEAGHKIDRLGALCIQNRTEARERQDQYADTKKNCTLKTFTKCCEQSCPSKLVCMQMLGRSQIRVREHKTDDMWECKWIVHCTQSQMVRTSF